MTLDNYSTGKARWCRHGRCSPSMMFSLNLLFYLLSSIPCLQVLLSQQWMVSKKERGIQGSLQHLCTWLLTPLVQADAHITSITTALGEEKQSGVPNPHVWLRKRNSWDNSCSWWIPSPCFCLAIFEFGISLIIQVRSNLGQLWWTFSKSSSLDSYCKRLPDDTMWSWNRLELCDDWIKSQWEPLPRSWDQFLM